MMHFNETDVNVLGRYNEELSRLDGDKLQDRLEKLGIDYDALKTGVF